MTLMKRDPSTSRGKLKYNCFQCRDICLPKDGDWHDGETNQVFLCKTCSHARKASASGMLLKSQAIALKRQTLLA